MKMQERERERKSRGNFIVVCMFECLCVMIKLENEKNRLFHFLLRYLTCVDRRRRTNECVC